MELSKAQREMVGRSVRETWVKYCIETGDNKSSHLVPYDELSEWDKEADRRIGEVLFLAGFRAAYFAEVGKEKRIDQDG